MADMLVNRARRRPLAAVSNLNRVFSPRSTQLPTRPARRSQCLASWRSRCWAETPSAASSRGQEYTRRVAGPGPFAAGSALRVRRTPDDALVPEEEEEETEQATLTTE